MAAAAAAARRNRGGRTVRWSGQEDVVVEFVAELPHPRHLPATAQLRGGAMLMFADEKLHALNFIGLLSPAAVDAADAAAAAAAGGGGGGLASPALSAASCSASASASSSSSSSSSSSFSSSSSSSAREDATARITWGDVLHHLHTEHESVMREFPIGVEGGEAQEQYWVVTAYQILRMEEDARMATMRRVRRRRLDQCQLDESVQGMTTLMPCVVPMDQSPPPSSPATANPIVLDLNLLMLDYIRGSASPGPRQTAPPPISLPPQQPVSEEEAGNEANEEEQEQEQEQDIETADAASAKDTPVVVRRLWDDDTALQKSTGMQLTAKSAATATAPPPPSLPPLAVVPTTTPGPPVVALRCVHPNLFLAAIGDLEAAGLCVEQKTAAAIINLTTRPFPRQLKGPRVQISRHSIPYAWSHAKRRGSASDSKRFVQSLELAINDMRRKLAKGKTLLVADVTCNGHFSLFANGQQRVHRPQQVDRGGSEGEHCLQCKCQLQCPARTMCGTATCATSANATVAPASTASAAAAAAAAVSLAAASSEHDAAAADAPLSSQSQTQSQRKRKWAYDENLEEEHGGNGRDGEQEFGRAEPDPLSLAPSNGTTGSPGHTPDDCRHYPGAAVQAVGWSSTEPSRKRAHLNSTDCKSANVEVQLMQQAPSSAVAQRSHHPQAESPPALAWDEAAFPIAAYVMRAQNRTYGEARQALEEAKRNAVHSTPGDCRVGVEPGPRQLLAASIFGCKSLTRFLERLEPCIHSKIPRCMFSPTKGNATDEAHRATMPTPGAPLARASTVPQDGTTSRHFPLAALYTRSNHA